MTIKALIPWWAKIIAKLLLSRIPASYQLWQRFGLFKHGGMERPIYAYDVFTSHYSRFDPHRLKKSFAVLELGPGDSLASALVAAAYGADTMHLIDTGPYARSDMAPYHQMIDYLKEKGMEAPDLQGVHTLSELLNRCRAYYGTDGINSLKEIPSGSVDFVYSQAVLEHVRKGEFAAMTRELRRIIRPDGMCSHRVDLKDHLGGALNNLRFPEALWESNFMARSGFYTNRINFKEMLRIFSDEGFSVDIVNVKRWDALPTPRRRMAKPFRALPDEELLMAEFDVVLKPRHEARSD